MPEKSKVYYYIMEILNNKFYLYLVDTSYNPE